MTWARVADLVAVLGCVWLAVAVTAAVWVCRRNRR
jgi:hypothetical protein